MSRSLKFFALILVSTFAASASAQSELDLDLSGLDAAYVAGLPALTEQHIRVVPGPRFAAVQPTMHLEFTYASCRQMNFEAKVTEVENLLVVAVENNERWDCRGLPRNRNYSLQIASDWARKPVLVLNPTGVKMPQIGN